MSAIHLRDKAKYLRRKGLSLTELSVKLKVSKSTVRYWCRDIVLSHKQQSRLFERQRLGGVLAAEKIRERRIKLTQALFKEGRKTVGGLSQREFFIAGIALYWAEGYRKGNEEFGFTNADPNMIRFIIRWLKKCCGVERDRISARVCINSIHRKRSESIRRSWSKITKIPLSQFSDCTFIKSVTKKAYSNHSFYLGTLRVKVKQGTNLRRRVMGWIDGISQSG